MVFKIVFIKRADKVSDSIDTKTNIGEAVFRELWIK